MESRGRHEPDADTSEALNKESIRQAELLRCLRLCLQLQAAVNGLIDSTTSENPASQVKESAFFLNQTSSHAGDIALCCVLHVFPCTVACLSWL